MLKFPMKFEVKAHANAGISTQWKAYAGDLPPIVSAIPPEFMGPGQGYSPEDLFAIALLNCLIATFKVYAEKSKFSFDSVEGKVLLTADKHAGDPTFMITHAEIFFHLKGASDPERGKRLLESAVKDCAISNSIKAAKSFHIEIS